MIVYLFTSTVFVGLLMGDTQAFTGGEELGIDGGLHVAFLAEKEEDGWMFIRRKRAFLDHLSGRSAPVSRFEYFLALRHQ